MNSCNQLLNTAGVDCGGVSSIECTMHVAVIDNEVICMDVSDNMVWGCGVWEVEKCPKM